MILVHGKEDHMSSILDDIKGLFSINNTDQDQDLMLLINSVFMILKQLGVGPENGFLLVDNTQTWVDFLEDRPDLEAIKTYVYLKVSLLFAPPSNEVIKQSLEAQISQFEQSLTDQMEGEVGTDSILNSVKKLLGIEEEYTHFDPDIILNINSVLMFINQLGIGPDDPLLITGKTETWSDLLGTVVNLEAVKTYLYLKVRLLFDPPTSSFVLESLDRQISMFEWRLNVQAETPVVEEE